jgi:hypothetical protein
MQGISAQRALSALFAVLIAVLVGMTLGASPASAKSTGPSHHYKSSHQVQRQEQAATYELAAASSKSGSGLGDLGDLLNSIINDTVPTVVKTVPTVLKTTVDTTTGVVKHTTDVVTTVLGGKKSTTTPTPTPTPTQSEPPTTPSAAPTTRSSTPATSRPPRSSASTTSNPPAAQQVRTAPLDGPNLVAATQPVSSHPTSKPAKHTQVDAITPASLLTAPGTGILIGAVVLFGLGVFVVVYSAGYRGRRVH